MEKLLEVMAALRHADTGCPWDLRQDFASIAPYTVEEAYEVADAIARDDLPALQDELGDLLFQVVFHARMASELGAFDFDDVAKGIADKMLRRHPHVFGTREERATGAVAGSWERIKAAERAEKRPGDGAAASVLDGIPQALPALKRAQKLGRRAATVGFDWPDAEGPRSKLDEELAELADAAATKDSAAVSEELGDVLFAAANLARHLDIDPEQALQDANRKFARRFRHMEDRVAASGGNMQDLDLAALENEWQVSKKALR